MKRSIIAALLLALVAVACGDGEAVAPTSSAASESDLPDVDVVDVVTGATVNVSALAPGDKPLLVWFWAPH